jgi:hypothetical protein
MWIEPTSLGANDKVSNMRVIGRMLFASIAALASLGAMSEQRADQPTSDNEIRIGNVMPYSGPLSEFGAIGQAEAAYFDKTRAAASTAARSASSPATTIPIPRPRWS